MSGDGFAAKRRAEQTPDEPNKHGNTSLFDELREQAGSMLGMAGMFVVTILLAMKIQPFYDRDELRAFGAEGANKAGFILLELIFILIFTAVIIFLARKNLQRFIKWGILGVLMIAMIYTLIPLMGSILLDEIPALEREDTMTEEAYIIYVDENGRDFFYVDDPYSDSATLRYVTNAGENEYWNHTIKDEFGGNSSGTAILSVTEDGVILCEGTQWLLLSESDGSVIDSHGKDCHVGLRYEPTDPSEWESCEGVDGVPQDWRIRYRGLEPIGYYNGSDDGPQVCFDWYREFPESFNGETTRLVRDIGTEHFLIVSDQWAGVVKYPTESTGSGPGEPPIPVETTWELSLTGDDIFTGVTFGALPGQNVTDSPSLVLGTNGGSVTTWDITEDGSVEEGSTMNLDGAVRGLLLADCCSGGSNDLWVIEDEYMRIFMGSNLVEMPRSLKIGGDDPTILLALHNVENEDSEYDDGVLLIEQDGVWSTTQYEVFVQDFTMVSIVSILVSIALIIVLIVRPEWYVINTVGILVGAGTITMLGVSFVPLIIIIFMILAAIYDAWAVYKSKHMLELADTMVGLELPVMLVAPHKGKMQPKSKMNENKNRQFQQSAQIEPIQDGGRLGETMLMGLGDVIFPGLLCISAMTWLPETDGPMGWSGSIWVALGTMVGSLIGYCVLMTYVARGRPQAGLPLLNGGAIIGYIISAAIFIGSAAFSFDISLF